MRLTAPAMAKQLLDGLLAEGATVLDAGMIGTEMLYFLVGSRGLDGGAMVTASHNPKAYTGVKLIREGALALSGDAGIGDVQARDRGRPRPGRPAAAPSRRSTSGTEFHATPARSIDPGDGAADAGGRRRRQRHGRARWSARSSRASASI